MGILTLPPSAVTYSVELPCHSRSIVPLTVIGLSPATANASELSILSSTLVTVPTLLVLLLNVFQSVLVKNPSVDVVA